MRLILVGCGQVLGPQKMGPCAAARNACPSARLWRLHLKITKWRLQNLLRPSHKTIYKPRWSLFFYENCGEFATANALKQNCTEREYTYKERRVRVQEGNKRWDEPIAWSCVTKAESLVCHYRRSLSFSCSKSPKLLYKKKLHEERDAGMLNSEKNSVTGIHWNWPLYSQLIPAWDGKRAEEE